jgi:hypothetical protein
MKAVNEYQLEPSAENFQKMRIELEKFGPAGADFVRFLQSVGPEFDGLQMAAREGMFPGMEVGIREVMDLLPQAERIIFNVSDAIGDLSAEMGEGLAGPKFAEFFEFLENSAGPILTDMGRTFGNFAEGIANLLVDFAPLSMDFSDGLLGMSRSFAEWTRGLDDTQGFEDFVGYIRESVPMVLDLFGSMVNAFVQIVEAAAPVGAVMVPALSRFLDVIAAIADTPLGTTFIAAAAGISIYGRAVALASITTSGLGKVMLDVGKSAVKSARSSNGLIARMSAMSGAATRAGAGVGLLALSMTDLDEKSGLSNTAMGALMGTMIAPGWGTAIGAIIGGVSDLSHANDELEAAIQNAQDALDSGSTAKMRSELKELNAQIKETEGLKFFGGTENESIGEDLTDELRIVWDALSGTSERARQTRTDLVHAINASGNRNGLLLLSKGLDITSDSFARSAQSAADFAHEVGRAFALLDKRASLRAARQAVRDFNKAMKEAPDTLKAGTPAYDKVEEALDGIARSSLDAAKHLRGMNRVNFLDKMRGQFVDAAREMGLTRRQAERLADQLGLLDKTEVKPEVDGDIKPINRKLNQARNWMQEWGREYESSTVDADNKPAQAKIQQGFGLLSEWDRRIARATVDVDISNVFSAVSEANSTLDRISDEVVNIFTVRKGKADGGTIEGPRQPYGDKVLAYLAPGEEVISNRYGQADRHRELLREINANRFADGGTAARAAAAAPTISVGGPSVSLAGAQITAVFDGVGRMVGRIVANSYALDVVSH